MSKTRIVYADEEEMMPAVKEAAKLLSAGEVVALPTETVYGLGADAFNADAVAKIYEAKGRPANDPLIVHVANRKQLREVAEIPPEIEKVIRKMLHEFWPGPLTLVLPRTDRVPDIVTAGHDTVAVRQSENKIFLAIIRELGRPIAAPSANRFGKISPTAASAVEKELGGRIPLIVDGGACNNGVESTIVRVEADEKRPILHLLRPGPISRKQLQAFGKVVIPKASTKKDADKTPDSPGQLSSHYAPSTPLLLFKDPSEFSPIPGKKYGLLSHKGDPKAGYIDLYDWECIETLSPGNGKLPEAAVRLYFLMRKLDEAGLDYIVAEPVSKAGIGLAIMDRLHRASVKTDAYKA